ncbi:hypothetical protein ACEPAI_3760 [Sanghuangporus weigelae]
MMSPDDLAANVALPEENESTKSQQPDTEREPLSKQTGDLEKASTQLVQEAKNDEEDSQANMMSKDLVDKFELINTSLDELVATLTRLHSENQEAVNYMDEKATDWRVRMRDIESVVKQ